MNPIRRSRPIPADGLERALRDGRHRRRRAAAFAGAPALSLVVAVVLVMQGGSGGKDSIGTLNDPEVTSTETSEPTATETPGPGESAEPSTGEEADPDSSAEPASEAECDDDGCSNEDDSGSYGTAPPHGDPMPRTDTHSITPYTGRMCSPRLDQQGYMTCAVTKATSLDNTIRPGETFTAAFEMCRGIDGKTDDLVWHWSGGQEKNAYVWWWPEENEETVWSEDQITTWVGAAHSDVMRQQTCFAWSVSWNGLLADGSPAKPGTYYLDATVTQDSGPDISGYVDGQAKVIVTE